MRGADYAVVLHLDDDLETSPHAWSRSGAAGEVVDLGGNISTCVEQISGGGGNGGCLRKHLHMRGADCNLLWIVQTAGETSPHAWSR